MSVTDFHFEYGRRLWRQGAPMPDWPDDDEETVSIQTRIWLGYMAERGLEIYKQDILRYHFEEGGPLPDGFGGPSQ